MTGISTLNCNQRPRRRTHAGEARKTSVTEVKTSVFALCAILVLSSNLYAAPVRLGCKVFTESVVLRDIAADVMKSKKVAVETLDPLGGTRVPWDALLNGQIDAYPEYTGTIEHEILHQPNLSPQQLADILKQRGVGITAPLGFNDTYAIGMLGSTAAKLGIKTLSDLAAHPGLRFGFSNEFLDRSDGWPALRDRYDLKPATVTGLDHDLAYRALSGGTIDLTDLYSTDAEIAYYHLRTLVDDRHLFPNYDAVFVYRLDLLKTHPDAVTALDSLAGKIDAAAMIAMNARVKLDKHPETEVADEFVNRTFDTAVRTKTQSKWAELWLRTREHLMLVGVSLAAAVVVSIPLGILAAKIPSLGQVILGFVSVLYTIPSLALLVFMIPLLGIGFGPAVVALFLYSLLPIVRNTYTGLTGIQPSLIESAEVLGLPAWVRLWRVELPLASPAILSGIQTSAVINIGTATLGALIGAGGYGQPILTGIRLDDTRLILLGAVPAAGLALVVQGLFILIERVFVPRGLRLKSIKE